MYGTTFKGSILANRLFPLRFIIRLHEGEREDTITDYQSFSKRLHYALRSNLDNMGDVDDDVWGDEEYSEHITISSNDKFQKDLEKLQEIHSNVFLFATILTDQEGYKAGIVAGQSQSTQEGFDKGYRKGADYGIEFGKVLGEMVGIARLELGTELKAEADDLVKEGWRLSQAAGKGLSKEDVEGYQRKCVVVKGRVKHRATVSLLESHN